VNVGEDDIKMMRKLMEEGEETEEKKLGVGGTS